MRVGLTVGLVATMVVVASNDARAWIFHEHWRITERAIEGLSGPDHAALTALWNETLRESPPLLCPHPVRVEARGEAPACITFTMLPAIAGDHSCSPPELSRFFEGARWLLRVLRVGADTEARLQDEPDQLARIDAWDAMHLALERADREYTSRAISNDGHFLLSRGHDELPAYLHEALLPSQHVNAASLYAIYHLGAIGAARAYALAPTGSKERAQYARRALVSESFALHFLEDSYSAGHFVGVWGGKATKKGTHDLYSIHGIDAVTWDKAPYSAHGDAFLEPVDERRTGDAVAQSLGDVLRAARGIDPGEDEPGAATAWVGLTAYDACRATSVSVSVSDAALARHVAPVWMHTPMPSSPPDATPPLRGRAEIGPYIAFQSGGSFQSLFGGYQSPENTPRAAGTLGAAVGVGYGLEGITTRSGDGNFFLTAGVDAESAQYDGFCGGECIDHRPVGDGIPRVPARIGYQLRLRMPFWLVPGDLLVAGPFLALVSMRDLTKMGILATDGGLIPWQRVVPTKIGDFQLVVGREVAFTYFDMDDRDRFLEFAGTDAAGARILNPVEVHGWRFEFPVLEYRPFRSFSGKLGSSLAAQLGAGFEVTSPNVGGVFSLYVRLFFDGRAYL